MPDFTFKKEEKLKSRKVIGRLFKEGQSFGMYPLRLIWLKLDNPLSESPVQFTLSVPKRAFPKAVHRNHLRRRVREAWRLNKHWLYEKMRDEEGQFAFMVLYTGKEQFEYKQIEAAMKRMIKKFAKRNLKSERKTNPN